MLPSTKSVNPTALRKAKIVCNFGLSECNRVKKRKLQIGLKDFFEICMTDEEVLNAV